MKSGDVVIYIDAEGAEHNALVGAVNPGDDSRLSVLYVDSGRDHEFNSGARENTIHWRVDLEHVDAKVNPVNCWKEVEVTEPPAPPAPPTFEEQLADPANADVLAEFLKKQAPPK